MCALIFNNTLLLWREWTESNVQKQHHLKLQENKYLLNPTKPMCISNFMHMPQTDAVNAHT